VAAGGARAAAGDAAYRRRQPTIEDHAFLCRLRERMAELGYQEGSNFTLDFVEVPSIDACERCFRELNARKPNILLASAPEINLKAALTVTVAPPIVMIAVDYDSVVRGYVSSLARPSGRITGISFQQVKLSLSDFNCSRRRSQTCGRQLYSGTRCPATNGKP
jgi:hypothetical protein